MLKKLIFIVIPLLLLTFCDKGTIRPQENGAYFYTAYDSLGTKIVSGILWLQFSSSGSISGSWYLQKTDDNDNIGPQTGRGKLLGSKRDSKIWINLNPDWADNNVHLWGKAEDGAISGDWIFSTFIGATNRGTFTAHTFSF